MNANNMIDEPSAIQTLRTDVQRLQNMQGRMKTCAEAWRSRPQVAGLFGTQLTELSAVQRELRAALRVLR